MTDSSDLDLTPREPADGPPKRSLRNLVIVGALVLVAGFILSQALGSARVFYRNVDEAVALRDELGDTTFRIQGTVFDEPVADASGALSFTIAFGGEQATVQHIGPEPSDLFRAGERVVAEGRWTPDETFESTQLLLKHSEEYVEDNPDRLGYEAEPESSEIAP